MHDIDEQVPISGNTKEKNIGPKTNSNSKETASAGGSGETVNASADYKNATEGSVANFADWLCGNSAVSKNQALSNSAKTFLQASSASQAMEDAKKAQTFTHNFVARYDYPKGDHYDGRYNNLCIPVDITIDVWTACKIDNPSDITKNTDYYLVRTSVLVRNDGFLPFSNEWDKRKMVSPFFTQTAIQSSIQNSSLRDQDCSPQTKTGSTDFQTSSGFSFSGNAGFNSNGPTGGVTGGYSITQTSKRSIPDISVNFSSENDSTPSAWAKWKFDAPDLEPYWGGFLDTVTKCDDPKSIQIHNVVVDAYALFTVRADKHCSEKDGFAKLTTNINAQFDCVCGWLEDAGFTLKGNNYFYNNWTTYVDFVQKPSNTCAEYIMSFKAPDGISKSFEDLHNGIKRFVSNWNDSENYYAVANSNSNIDAALDAAAKKNFDNVKKKITDNKSTIKEAGFSGKFKFYIKRVSAADGTYVADFDLTF